MFNSRTSKEIKYLIKTYTDFFKPIKQKNTSLKINNRQIEIETLWSNYDYCYFTISPNYKKIVGTGITSKDSEKSFTEKLDNYLKNKNKGGRPKAGNIILSCHVPEDIKSFVDSCCRQQNINQGQFITELIKIYQSQHS